MSTSTTFRFGDYLKVPDGTNDRGFPKFRTYAVDAMDGDQVKTMAHVESSFWQVFDAVTLAAAIDRGEVELSRHKPVQFAAPGECVYCDSMRADGMVPKTRHTSGRACS